MVVSVDRECLAAGGECSHRGHAQSQLSALRAAQINHFNVLDLCTTDACGRQVEGSITHHQDVGTGFAVHSGIGRVINQGVIASACQDGVGTRASVDPVGVEVCDGDAIGILRAQQVFNAIEIVIVSGVGKDGRAQGVAVEGDGHTCRSIRKIGRVHAQAAHQGVRALPAHEPVVAQATF